MASVAELEQERTRLSALLKQQRRALKCAERRVAVEAQAWVLPPPVRRVAIALYHLAECEAEPVVKYLEARGRERGWPTRAAAELRALVEDLYLAATHEEIAALVDTVMPADADALAVALKLVSEWRVVASARVANNTSGVVPTETMLQQYEQLRQTLPEGLRPRPLGVASERPAKRWACRLRKQWGGRYGTIPPAEPIDAAELDAKATPTCEPAVGGGEDPWAVGANICV